MRDHVFPSYVCAKNETTRRLSSTCQQVAIHIINLLVLILGMYKYDKGYTNFTFNKGSLILVLRHDSNFTNNISTVVPYKELPNNVLHITAYNRIIHTPSAVQV